MRRRWRPHPLTLLEFGLAVGAVVYRRRARRRAGADLIETAVLGLLGEFEQIDAEEGCPCTCGSPKAHASFCRYRPAPRD